MAKIQSVPVDDREAAARALLDAAQNPFADPVARLDTNEAPAHVESLHAAVRAELERAISSVGETRRPSMILVQGDPGQGKTHELARLRALGERTQAFEFVEIPPLKDAGAPFQHVLRYFVQGLIAQKRLDRFLWEALRQVALAVRVAADDSGDDELRDRLNALLTEAKYVTAFRTLAREDPKLGELLNRRGRTLSPLRELEPDVARVLCRIPDRDVEALALDWLRGAELPEEDLKILGVARSIESESRCFETLRSLVALSPRPLALCFDQLESTSGLLGQRGILSLFTALMELYQQLPVCIVLMCQTQVWAELRPIAPQAALERIKIAPVLALPTPDEALRLVEARLAPLFGRAGVTPPYPSFPFAPSELRAFVDEVRPSVRQVLMRCGGLLDGMRARGRIDELSGDPGHAMVVPLVFEDPVRAIGEEHKQKLRLVGAREELRSPRLRQELLRSAIVDCLRGAETHQRELHGGIRVLDVAAPPKPASGARPPLLVTLGVGERELRVALEVHSDEARGALHALERLRERVLGGEADVAVMVRENEAQVGATARRTLELAKSLEPRGGIVYLDREPSDRLVAGELLLDAAAAGMVPVGRRAATREEALAFLVVEHELAQALAPLAERVTRPAV